MQHNIITKGNKDKRPNSKTGKGQQGKQNGKGQNGSGKKAERQCGGFPRLRHYGAATTKRLRGGKRA